MSDNVTGKWARLSGLVQNFVTAWALLGGFILAAVILVNVGSVVSSALFNKPFAGDFELTEMGVGVAAFCFLPYCQLMGANVSADIFTVNAGRFMIAVMGLLASVIALAFALLLAWRMTAGLQDYIEYEEITGILSIPLWWAFIPSVISLLLLVVTTMLSLRDSFNEIRKAV